jgi:hypothetical protein
VRRAAVGQDLPVPDPQPPAGARDQETPQLIVVSDGEEAAEEPREVVEQPAKVMRIGSMIKQLLDEVRQSPLDERARTRLAEIYETSVRELADGLSPDLRSELERMSMPLSSDGVPSESELRVAQAQLVGWLEGLFHGIQATLFAQQVAAQNQLQQMRQRGLPPGASPGPVSDGPGSYL